MAGVEPTHRDVTVFTSEEVGDAAVLAIAAQHTTAPCTVSSVDVLDCHALLTGSGQEQDHEVDRAALTQGNTSDPRGVLELVDVHVSSIPKRLQGLHLKPDLKSLGPTVLG